MLLGVLFSETLEIVACSEGEDVGFKGSIGRFFCASGGYWLGVWASGVEDAHELVEGREEMDGLSARCCL